MWYRPTKTAKISDDFNDHKKRGSVNPGVDYPVKVGTEVRAIADGTVIKVINNIRGAGGRMVLVKHSGYKTDYLHLSKILCTRGNIKAGDLLGLSGASGLGSENHYGPHLHLSIRKGGTFLTGRGNLDYEAFMAAENAKIVEAAAVVESTPMQ
jgi:murein DD-endopeptidase MepM/ murein hydrolase activator NlpD